MLIYSFMALVLCCIYFFTFVQGFSSHINFFAQVFLHSRPNKINSEVDLFCLPLVRWLSVPFSEFFIQPGSLPLTLLWDIAGIMLTSNFFIWLLSLICRPLKLQHFVHPNQPQHCHWTFFGKLTYLAEVKYQFPATSSLSPDNEPSSNIRSVSQMVFDFQFV